MIDQWHYVPVLRWKAGERAALAHLAEDVRPLVTPLLELPQSQLLGQRRKRPPSPDEFLNQMAAEVLDKWGEAPLFIDFGLLESVTMSDGCHPLAVFGKAASSTGAGVIPVTGLSRSTAYQSAVRAIVHQQARGIALRLAMADFDGAMAGRLERVFRDVGVSLEHVDLLIDCQVVDGEPPDYGQILQRIPHTGEWRSITVLAGAFPKDLTAYSPGIHRRDRTDWIGWRDQVGQGARALPRAPAYGDYATLYPIFEEPPRRANPSASIRYTADDYWLIMRGEALRKKDGPGSAQWTAQAQLLQERHVYCGADFSWGDRFIFEKAHSDRPGNPQQWLSATVNHHITVTARQIANLRDS